MDKLKIKNLLFTKLRRSKFLKKFFISKWKKEGYKIPPPHFVKQEIISYLADRFKIDTLVETGTYYGDMVYSQRNNFKKIFSIEIGDELYLRAKSQFKEHNHIHLLLGDSADKMKDVIPNINGTVLFWLDAHYQGGNNPRGVLDTPIVKEISNIFQLIRKDIKFIILIDDLRLFNGSNDYPTLDEFRIFIKESNNRLSFFNYLDFIFISNFKDETEIDLVLTKLF